MKPAVSFAALALAFCFASAAFALDFPALTGRVVDQAGILKSGTRSDIEEMLKNLEDKSGIQLAVATVPSLQGSDIETYANELFRAWKLGEGKKNNGVLLLVAPTERKVRIEVGYGLEGKLTDAISSVIISSAIVPFFKSGDYSDGIERGVEGIIDVLNGDSAEWQPKVSVRQESAHSEVVAAIVGIFIISFLVVAVIRTIVGFFVGGGRHSGRGRHAYAGSSSSSSSSFWSDSSSSSSSSSSSDSFSGGGGSSGGGGASGSW